MGAIAEHAQLRFENVSRHLRILFQARVVSKTHLDNQRIYSLDPDFLRQQFDSILAYISSVTEKKTE